jgi:hypothetical protein
MTPQYSWTLTRDEPARFFAAFAFLAASKHASLKDEEIEVAHQVLGDLPIESVERAMRLLSKQAGDYLPSTGDIYEVADNDAAELLVSHRSSEVAQLSAGRMTGGNGQSHPGVERLAFIAQYEKLSGKTLPSGHVWKTGKADEASYSCPDCQDIGWVNRDCLESNQCRSCRYKRRLYDHTYVEQCMCFDMNPVLRAARAGNRLKLRIRENRRKA